ncbi:hypothetical protein SF83666_c37950 [Sinorhizobium fredii CCBAU 83666]|nr:hypothetical protein SF83666_c37950 [Sinorhizobium fredii CCBAU 83666]
MVPVGTLTEIPGQGAFTRKQVRRVAGLKAERPPLALQAGMS